MTATLASGTGVEIVGTDIVTGGRNSDVVSNPLSDLQLYFTVAFDLAQIGWNTSFTANFQVEDCQTGKRTNTYWFAPLSALPQLPHVWVSYSWSAAALGAASPGIFRYRPSFTVHVPNVNELPAFLGDSDFAVAEEHFFTVEGFPAGN